MPKPHPLIVDSARNAIVELTDVEGRRAMFMVSYLALRLDKCRTCVHGDAMCERKRKVQDAVVDTVFEGDAIIWACAAYAPRRAGREEGEA